MNFLFIFFGGRGGGSEIKALSEFKFSLMMKQNEGNTKVMIYLEVEGHA